MGPTWLTALKKRGNLNLVKNAHNSDYEEKQCLGNLIFFLLEPSLSLLKLKEKISAVHVQRDDLFGRPFVVRPKLFLFSFFLNLSLMKTQVVL